MTGVGKGKGLSYYQSPINEAWCSNKIGKKHKTTIFKIASFRYLRYLRWLLEASLAHYGEFWEPKWTPKINENKSQNGFRFFTTFWTSFGPISESVLGLELAPNGDQKCDQFWGSEDPGVLANPPSLFRRGILTGVGKGKGLSYYQPPINHQSYNQPLSFDPTRRTGSVAKRPIRNYKRTLTGLILTSLRTSWRMIIQSEGRAQDWGILGNAPINNCTQWGT